MSEAQKPTVPYWHLWTDEAGVSHQTRCFFSEFELASMQASIEPQWQGSKTKDGATVFVTVQPVGWAGEWHENPKPQWIIPLSGRWSVESMDGQQVEMGPGRDLLRRGSGHARDGWPHRSLLQDGGRRAVRADDRAVR